MHPWSSCCHLAVTALAGVQLGHAYAVRYRVLGSIEVSDGGGNPLSLAGSRQRALLACLLAHANQVVPADRREIRGGPVERCAGGLRELPRPACRGTWRRPWRGVAQPALGHLVWQTDPTGVRAALPRPMTSHVSRDDEVGTVAKVTRGAALGDDGAVALARSTLSWLARSAQVNSPTIGCTPLSP
jgi:hypothetical protein